MRLRSRFGGTLAREILVPSYGKGALAFERQAPDFLAKALACGPVSNEIPLLPLANATWISTAGLSGLAGASRSGNFPRFNPLRVQLPRVLGWDVEDVWKVRKNWPPFQPVCPSEKPASAALIDGLKISKQIKDEIFDQVEVMKEKTGSVPGLAVVLVGSRKDSEAYVRNKKMACEEVGIKSFGVHLPEEASEEEVISYIKTFNADPAVHGVLVQLPLPKHMNEERVLGEVSLQKDVDGFHPLNIGRLAMHGRDPLFVPCTPKGCIELLLRSGIQMAGKHAVVIGRSNIVGIPAAMLLQKQNMTVTVVHVKTKNPEEITRNADVVIAAVGVPNLVRGHWLKPGAVVIDVGINPMEDATCERGYRLVGDVCYEEAVRVASAITPVPGGVGPMTIAMLLSNTVESAKRAYGLIRSPRVHSLL
eukprot:TRINITY_DN4543_c0_g1_i1.p1 TRINITY_DN4543_c0_g1~~TRINITY_DN4543_c0_g1_i1.p1  ORF type:complete len:420 (-),score=58.09 TRINITY_DN4543_c0_g1_i1:692-1951(-)